MTILYVLLMIIPNTTQVPNYILDVAMPQLTDTALRVLLTVARQTFGWIEDPETGRRKEKDWISYSQLQTKTGRSTKPISRSLRELEFLGLIQVYDERGHILRTKNERIGKKLLYRVTTKSELLVNDLGAQSETTSLQSTKVLDNLFTKENLQSKDTKETYTKTVLRTGGVSVKTPACPLLNDSSLKAKYPNGHEECVEYLVSLEEDRSYKFTNRAKQFNFIHKMLRAGADFEVMDRVISVIEKKYGRNQWDFATVSNWLDKGGDNAKK